MKKTRWNSCNVLQPGSPADARSIWAFNAAKNGFALASEMSVPAGQTLPATLVGKDWRILLQPKLNIALLNPEKVFLRVVHLPSSNFEELLSMVELQLEKVSPLPVTQVVWTMHLVGPPVENLQTVIVIIVERDLVDKLMGQLEGQGFLADRLELLQLDQLLATRITADGAWIYPSHSSGKFTALVAWWSGGVLRNLSLIHIPAVPERAALLQEQLQQMAWSGELEGWLTAAPQWRMVADPATAAAWEPMFQPWLGRSIEVTAPLSSVELATLTANRSARAKPRANLLPPEYSIRYHQEFIDRLWIRGLGAVVGAYAAIVMLYFFAAQYQEMKTGDVERSVRMSSTSYTNALQVKAKLQVLQDRQALKFASLDCWKTVAELLPESLTLNSLDVKGGRTLTLTGQAPTDQGKLVTEFNEALRKATRAGVPMFEKVDIASTRLNPDKTTMSWSFACDLASGEDGQ